MDKNVQINSFYENGVFQDFYQILEVSEKATEEEIKRSFRRLSKLYHPDMPTHDEEEMKRIGIAYGILKKEDTRKLYDGYYHQLKGSNKTTTSSSYTSNSSNTMNHNYSSTSKSYNYSNNSNRDSQYSYNHPFTENEIRDILRKNHYSEFKIEDFLYWCRKQNIQIYSMSGLSTYFSRYMVNKKQEERTTSNREYRKSAYSKKAEDIREAKTVSSRNTVFSSYTDSFLEFRKMLVRRMVLEEMIESYLYQNRIDSYRNISNFRVYTPMYSTVRLYHSPVYTSNVIFYSPSRRYVYQLYR